MRVKVVFDKKKIESGTKFSIEDYRMILADLIDNVSLCNYLNFETCTGETYVKNKRLLFDLIKELYRIDNEGGD